MPDTPTAGVNGQVRSTRALHASMSRLSCAPAAMTFGWAGSTATPGSFCLFCENRLSLLPTVTSVEPPGVIGTAPADTVGTSSAVAAASATPARRVVRIDFPPCVRGWMRRRHPGRANHTSGGDRPPVPRHPSAEPRGRRFHYERVRPPHVVVRSWSMAETAPAARRPLVLPRPSDSALVRTGVVAAVALFAVYVVLPSTWVVLPDLILFPLAGAFSVGCVVAGVRHHRPAAPQAWLLIGAGLGLFTLGYLVTGIYEVTIGHDPFPSASDIFYLAGYPLILAGLVVAVRVRQWGGLDPWAGIDAGILAAVAALVAWLSLVGPARASDELSYAAGI